MPEPGDADTFLAGQIDRRDRFRNPYLRRDGTADRPGGTEQALQGIADVTRETIRSLDEEGTGRRIDEDQELERHLGQPPCPGRI